MWTYISHDLCFFVYFVWNHWTWIFAGVLLCLICSAHMKTLWQRSCKLWNNFHSHGKEYKTRRVLKWWCSLNFGPWTLFISLFPYVLSRWSSAVVWSCFISARASVRVCLACPRIWQCTDPPALYQFNTRRLARDYSPSHNAVILVPQWQ